MVEEVPIQADAPVEDASEEPFTVVAKKKRGRPPGALNKAKQAVIQEVPIVPIPEKQEKKQKPKPKPKPPPPSESEEEAPAPKRQKKKQAARPPSDSEEEPVRRKPRPAPIVPPDAHQLAAQVLQLLSTRHVGQANARREKYASWFAQ